MNKIKNNPFLYAAAALFIAAAILFIMAVGTVNSDTYNYYEDQYDECMRGYGQCMAY